MNIKVGDWVQVLTLTGGSKRNRWLEEAQGRVSDIRDGRVWVNNAGYDMRGTDVRIIKC